MTPQQTKMIRGIAISLFFIFTAIALLYTLDIDILHSQLILATVSYAFTVTAFMSLVMVISLPYQFSMMKGKPLPGFYSSIFYKHLTNEQIVNLSRTDNGRERIFFHEFMVMRMDVIFPAAIIFLLFIISQFPNSSNPAVYGILACLEGLFALSYVVYSINQATMIGIKMVGSIPPEQAISNMEDVIRITAMEM